MSSTMNIPKSLGKFWNADTIRDALLDDGKESLEALKGHIEEGGSLRKVTKVARKLLADRVHPNAFAPHLSNVADRFSQVIESKSQYLLNIKLMGDLLLGLLRSARDAIFRWFKVGAVEDAKEVLAKLRPIDS